MQINEGLTAFLGEEDGTVVFLPPGVEERGESDEELGRW